MAQTPNVIGSAVLQRLKERGEAATPENYERTYYELSGLARPPKTSESAGDNRDCSNLLAMLRQMVREITDTTGNLANDLGEKNQGLSEDVSSLKSCRDKQEIVLGRLQQAMARAPLKYEGKKINTTLSAGVATLRPDENGHALLRRADDAVYAAKNSGRNAIWLAP